MAKMTTNEWCESNGIALVHYAAVKMVLNRLTDPEIAAQFNAASAGFDPRPVHGYDKMSEPGGLLNPEDDPPRYRPEEVEIMGREVGIRLEKARQRVT